MQKRGLSTIVASLIIILLSLVAIGVVWVVVNRIIQGGVEEVSLGKFTINMEIDKNSLVFGENSLSVKVERKPGAGDLAGIKFILSDGANTEIIEKDAEGLGELGQKTFVLNPSKIIIIKKISIAPIIKTESGKKIAGNVLDEYELLPKETVMGINGLISWWRFEGNANDEKGINNGTIISNVQFVDSKDGLGKTASFDGNGSWDGKGSHILIGYVSNENKLKINKDMTAGIWFKRNTPAVEGGKTLGLLGNWKWSTNVNEQSGWRFAFYNGRSNLDFTIVTKNDAGNIESDTATYDINSIGLNEWHYATGVFNSSAQKAYLYVDGTLKGTSGSTQSTIVTDNAAGIYPLRIGYNPINNGYFNGSIDEVMIFNRALSTTEISSLYTLG